MIRLCSRFVVPRVTLMRLPKGTPGTLATARLIVGLIRDGTKDFYVRQEAIEEFRAYRVPAKDRLGKVWSLFDWVRPNVRYARDIYQVALAAPSGGSRSPRPRRSCESNGPFLSINERRRSCPVLLTLGRS